MFGLTFVSSMEASEMLGFDISTCPLLHGFSIFGGVPDAFLGMNNNVEPSNVLDQVTLSMLS